MGDINAHSTIWDDNARNGVTDRRGEKIEDWLAENNMACINTGEATHISRSTGKEGTPDTSFIHSSLLDKVSWKTTNKMGSDHKPIIITYEDQMMKIKTRTKYKWKISEADWEKFTNEIEQKIPQNFKRMSVNKLEKKLRKTILKSAKDHIGKKKITQHTKAWLTPEIKESIKKRNELRKTVAQNRTEWIEACKSTAELITEKKKELWKEYVDGISATTSSIQIWRTIKGMDGRRPPDRNNETLEANGKSYTDDKDKANLFAKTYRGFAKIPIQKEDRITRKYIRRRMKRRPLVHQEAEQEFTMDELDRALSEAKNNKATGEDDIPYEMLKNLGEKAKEILLWLYNSCWNGNGIPTKWRTAIIKPLLKDGKDPKLTESYRPISLTSCVGKILEKLAADRLIFILESRNILNDNQAGFRPNRCTTDQVLKLVQNATDQIHNSKANPRTMTTFFDYEKAFDKVWRDGLLLKMIKLNIPEKLIRYVRHFLSGRKTRVEFNGTRSKAFRLDQGLPQGSCISPLLFLIFINDIDVDLHPDTIASLFADDTHGWLTERSRDLIAL